MLTSDFDSEYAFFLEIVVFVLSSLGSALFLFMIMKKTEPLMQVYQIILYYSCLFDWIITFTSFFTRPIFFIDDGNFYLLANYFMQKVPNLQFFFYFTYIFAFHSLPAVVAYIFYYRYLVVCKEKIMTTRSFCFYAALTNMGCLLMVIANYLWLTPNQGANKETVQNHISQLNTSFIIANKEKIVAFAENTDPAGYNLYIIGTLYTFTAYFITIVCVVKVVKTFRVRNENSRWHSVNRQIAKSLIVQLITPSVTMVPMFILMATCVLLNPSEGFVTGCNYVMNITLTLMPVLNPFVAASFIDSYRQAATTVLLYPFCCFKKTKTTKIKFMPDSETDPTSKV